MRKLQIITTAAFAAALAMPMVASAQTELSLPVQSVAKAVTQEKLLIDEDFSKMTAGSESNPDLSFNINTCEGEPDESVFYSCVNSAYTHESGWGSYMVYPAGGMVYFNNTRVSESYAAHINPPLFDASDCNGTFFIRFRARLTEKNPNYVGLGLRVQDATDPDALQWIKFATVSGLTSTEWKEFTVRVDGGTKKTRIILCEEYGTNVLLDDLQIYQLKESIPSPNVLRYLYYNGTSFRPRWNKVEGATKYYVNVFQSDATGAVGSSVVTDFETTDTICTIRGLVPGAYYRYNVAASDGVTRSLASRNMVLNDILPPSLNDVEIEDGKYTASWDDVPGALFYNYYAYADRVADKDGEFTLMDEDFTGVTDAGGNVGYVDTDDKSHHDWVAGSEPDTWQTRPYGSPLHTKMAGYYANNWLVMGAGYMFLDGWFYYNDQKENVQDPETDDDVKQYSKFETPVLNLSNDGGKVKVSVDLWGMKDLDTDDKRQYPTNANIALVNFDAVTGQYVEVERHHFDLTEKWTNAECEFSKGGEDSKIVIYTTDGPGVVYIDNFKVAQNLKKGDSFASCIACETGLTSNAVAITLPTDYKTTNLYHRVVAVTEHESKVLSRTYFYWSGPSEQTLFHEGNAETAINDASVTGPAKVVARYGVDGTRLAGENKGVNILKMSDGTTRKVVVK